MITVWVCGQFLGSAQGVANSWQCTLWVWLWVWLEDVIVHGVVMGVDGWHGMSALCGCGQFLDEVEDGHMGE